MKRTVIPVRFYLILFTFSLSLLLYIDRVTISASKSSIVEDLNLTDIQMGWVMSVFALGYALLQVPSGYMIDMFGSRKILSAIVAFWSLFTGLTGAAWNFVSLLITRLFFGMGEAGAFPAVARSVFSWIPLRERGIVTGINFSGSRLGAAFALPLLGILISEVGWRSTFLILGFAGIIWAIFWYLWFRDLPEKHPSLSESEKQYIITNRQQQSSDTVAPDIPVRKIFASGNVWLAMMQYVCSNYIFFFCLTWMLPMLQRKYALDLKHAGFYSSVPLIAGAFGNWFSGLIVDGLYKRGKWVLSRRLPAIIGFILVVAGVLLSMNQPSPARSVIWMAVAIFGADMTLTPSWSFCIDIGKSNSGKVSGAMNMAGNLGSFITAIAFPYLLAWTGSDQTFFYIAAIINSFAILIWCFMRPDKPIT
jgi:MFS transporter, ACS family, glucarate transporter